MPALLYDIEVGDTISIRAQGLWQEGRPFFVRDRKLNTDRGETVFSLIGGRANQGRTGVTSSNSLMAAPLKVATIETQQALNPTTPITNLLDPRPRRLVEAVGTSLTLDIDLGAATEINLVALLFTNAGHDATWSIRAANRRSSLARAPWLVALRVVMEGGTVAGGKLQVGRIMISNALQPTWNHALGSSMARRPLVDEAVSRTGQVSRRLWQRRRILTLRYPELTEEELYGALMPIAERADAEPVLIIQEPANTRYRMEMMVYGMLTVQTSKVSPGEYDARLTLTEWR